MLFLTEVVDGAGGSVPIGAIGGEAGDDFCCGNVQLGECQPQAEQVTSLFALVECAQFRCDEFWGAEREDIRSPSEPTAIHGEGQTFEIACGGGLMGVEFDLDVEGECVSFGNGAQPDLRVFSNCGATHVESHGRGDLPQGGEDVSDSGVGTSHEVKVFGVAQW